MNAIEYQLEFDFPEEDDPFAVTEECPHCGESIWIELLGAEVDWRPCCEACRSIVESWGFEEFYGVTLLDVVRCYFPDAREVFGAGCVDEKDPDAYFEDTTRVRFPLEEKIPGAGVKGWQAEVFSDVDEHHSHHDAPTGWKFGVAVMNGFEKVGVAVVGRPVSRLYEKANPDHLEVTRVCCFGHPKLRRNAATKLYAMCANEAKKLGCTKLITFTLVSEDATSLKAAGWTPVKVSGGGSWGRKGRPREDKAPTERKVRWERVLDKKKATALPAIELPRRDVDEPQAPL